MDFGIVNVAAITVICYLVAQMVKATSLDNKWLPVLCGLQQRQDGCFEPEDGRPYPGSPGAQQLCKANAGGGGADQGY